MKNELTRDLMLLNSGRCDMMKIVTVMTGFYVFEKGYAVENMMEKIV